VTNLAARLCGEAGPGQILISRRLLGLVEDLVDAEPVGGPDTEGVRAAGVDVQRARAAGGVRGNDPPRALARPDLAVVAVRIPVRRCAGSVPIVPGVRLGPSILYEFLGAPAGALE
jgi:hypothetical protein